MKKTNIVIFCIAVFSSVALGQNKGIRITPLPKQPEPLCILDGMNVPSNITKEFLSKEKQEIIDLVSIQMDSIFDCDEKLVHLGIVKIYTKDSIHRVAKMIMSSTDNYLYYHPLTILKINNKNTRWDEEAFNVISKLKVEDFIYAKIKKRNNRESILKLKIKK